MLALIAAVCWSASFTAASEFYRIGGLTKEDGTIRGRPEGVSGDGSVVVGNATGIGAWIWTPTEGITQPDNFSFRTVRGISTDGMTVVGNVQNEFEDSIAHYWTAEQGMREIEIDPSAGIQQFPALDVSDDGSTILGWVTFDEERPREQALWTESDGIQLFGAIPGAFDGGIAALSGNAEFVAHNFEDAESFEHTGLKWSQDGGYSFLADPDLGVNPDAIETRTTDVANDGTVVGFVRSGHPLGLRNGIVWSPDGPTHVIGVLSEYGHDFIRPSTISNDAAVVLGSSSGDGLRGLRRAFSWTQRTGIEELEAVLSRDYGLTETHPWGLQYARHISDDRRVIAGNSSHPTLGFSGGREAWVVYLDWPLGSIRSDFDLDDVLDADDADLLVTAILNESTDPLYDLDANEIVGLSDLDDLLARAGRINGDADFNGEVDFADFLVVSANFGEAGLWSEGDFDANGEVAFADFLILSGNFGTSPAVASVPEPASSAWCLACTLGLLIALRLQRGTATSRGTV